jgi:hypothetical protein
MVCFQTKYSYLGKFWRALEWKMLVFFIVIWIILRSFGKFYGHLVMLWKCGTFFFVLVYCAKKNLATLGHRVISGGKGNFFGCEKIWSDTQTHRKQGPILRPTERARIHRNHGIRAFCSVPTIAAEINLIN